MVKELLIANICAMLFAITSGVLAFYGKDGWGWFLIAAIMCCHTLKYKKDKTGKDA